MEPKQLSAPQKTEAAQVAAKAVEWYNTNVSSFKAHTMPDSKLDKISISNVAVRQRIPGYWEVDILGWGRKPHEGPDLLFERTSEGLKLRASYVLHAAFFVEPEQKKKSDLSGWKLTKA